MTPAIPTPLNARLVAMVAALVLAAAAAFAAASSASSPVVHTAIDSTGSIHVSGYDGGVALSGKTQR